MSTEKPQGNTVVSLDHSARHAQLTESSASDSESKSTDVEVPQALDDTKKTQRKKIQPKTMILLCFGSICLLSITISAILFLLDGSSGNAGAKLKKIVEKAKFMTPSEQTLSVALEEQILLESLRVLDLNLSNKDKIVTAAITGAEAAKKLNINQTGQLEVARKAAIVAADRLPVGSEKATAYIALAVHNTALHLGIEISSAETEVVRAIQAEAAFKMALAAGYDDGEALELVRFTSVNPKSLPFDAHSTAEIAISAARTKAPNDIQSARRAGEAAILERITELSSRAISVDDARTFAKHSVFNAMVLNGTHKNLKDAVQKRYRAERQSGSDHIKAMESTIPVIEESARHLGGGKRAVEMAIDLLHLNQGSNVEAQTANELAEIYLNTAIQEGKSITPEEELRIGFIRKMSERSPSSKEAILAKAIYESQIEARKKGVSSAELIDILSASVSNSDAIALAQIQHTIAHKSPSKLLQAAEVGRHVAAVSTDNHDVVAARVARATAELMGLPQDKQTIAALISSTGAILDTSESSAEDKLSALAGDVFGGLDATSIPAPEKLSIIADVVAFESESLKLPSSATLQNIINYTDNAASEIGLPNTVSFDINDKIIQRHSERIFNSKEEAVRAVISARALNDSRYLEPQRRAAKLIQAHTQEITGEHFDRSVREHLFDEVQASIEEINLQPRKAHLTAAVAIAQELGSRKELSQEELIILNEKASSYFRAVEIGMDEQAVKEFVRDRLKNITSASGLDEARIAEALSNVSKVNLAEIPVNTLATEAENEEYAQIHKGAVNEALSAGLDSAEAMRFAAGKLAEAQARNAGRGDFVQALSKARAEANYRARASGLKSESVEQAEELAVKRLAQEFTHLSKTEIAKGLQAEEADHARKNTERMAQKKARTLGLSIEDQIRFIDDAVNNTSNLHVSNPINSPIKESRSKPSAINQLVDSIDGHSVERRSVQEEIDGHTIAQLRQLMGVVARTEKKLAALEKLHSSQPQIKESVMEEVRASNKIMSNKLKSIERGLKNITKASTVASEKQSKVNERLCEIEAALKVYSNPISCAEIYRSGRPGSRAAMQPEVQHKSAEIRIQKSAYEKKDTATQGNNRSKNYSEKIPKTRGERKEKVFAVIPKTSNYVNHEKIGVGRSERQGVCKESSQEWVYKSLSEHKARIINTKDRTRGLMTIREGSMVNGLGTVMAFHVKSSPKYIVFTDSVVCKG